MYSKDKKMKLSQDEKIANELYSKDKKTKLTEDENMARLW